MINKLTNKLGESFMFEAYQIEAYEHLLNNPKSVLFLGMSLGKTAVTLAYLHDMLYEELAFTKVLVIAPAKVARLTWPQEVEKWANFKGMRLSLIAGDETARLKALNTEAEIYVIGVDSTVWLTEQYYSRKSSGKWQGSFPFDCVVLDELSLFKSRDSERFKALRRAIKDVPYRIGLTGTPVPNGYVDLWSQMVLIDNGERLGASFVLYRDLYFTTRGNGMIVYEYSLKKGADKTIHSKIKDIALSMQTRDKIELPPLHLVDTYLELDAFDRENYDMFEREYILEEHDITAKTAADLSMKLIQLSSGAIYNAEREIIRLHDTKLNALADLLAEYPNENFIVVYQFVHEVERILEKFPFARQLRQGKGLNEDFEAWNRGEIKLLLLHPKGAGHGLNLQFGGRRMVWFSLTWNLEHWLQTVARLLRRGADKDVIIHRLIVRKTLDERIKKRVEAKDDNQNFLLNELKNYVKQRKNVH